MATKEKNLTKRAGGIAVAKKMTAEQLRERATKGAVARWGDKLPLATHKGNFKDEFGIEAECFVLNDPTKTAVISQSGMGRALGFSARSNSVTRFLATEAIANAVDAELLEKIENPIKFQWATGGATNAPNTIGHGFDVTLLVDICRLILRPDVQAKLSKHRSRDAITRQAGIIIGASAKAGIKGLVYALAGYQPHAQEVIKAFKRFVQEEARKYEKEFPNELYQAWYRLYEIPEYERGRPWFFKTLTVRQIYYPLAQSNGKILELMRALKANDAANQKAKLFQFLNELGARALRLHMGRVLEMAESSPDRLAYEGKIRAKFGTNHELDLVIPEVPASEQPQPSSQSSSAPEETASLPS